MAQKLKALRFGDQVFDLTGKADLVSGKVPASQLPSYVDDVIEVADFAALPGTGESGKIYITLDNGKIFRWGGSLFAEIPTTPQKLETFTYTGAVTGFETSKVSTWKDAYGNVYFRWYATFPEVKVTIPQGVICTLPDYFNNLAVENLGYYASSSSQTVTNAHVSILNKTLSLKQQIPDFTQSGLLYFNVYFVFVAEVE
jgi:hypothetical protein